MTFPIVKKIGRYAPPELLRVRSGPVVIKIANMTCNWGWLVTSNKKIQEIHQRLGTYRDSRLEGLNSCKLTRGWSVSQTKSNSCLLVTCRFSLLPLEHWNTILMEVLSYHFQTPRIPKKYHDAASLPVKGVKCPEAYLGQVGDKPSKVMILKPGTLQTHCNVAARLSLQGTSHLLDRWWSVFWCICKCSGRKRLGRMV